MNDVEKGEEEKSRRLSNGKIREKMNRRMLWWMMEMIKT